MKFLLILLLLFVHGISLACMVPPPSRYVSNIELIKRTPDIALAKVTEQKGESFFRFQTIEVIRGNVPKEFILTGASVDNVVHLVGDFSQHENSNFWTRQVGNSGIRPNCQTHGIFEAGKTYLIFYAEPFHIHSFEEIRSPDDRWLQFVKNKVKHLGRSEKPVEGQLPDAESQSIVHHFRSVSWGMTVDQLKQAETGVLVKENPENELGNQSLVYNVQFPGYQYELKYNFKYKVGLTGAVMKAKLDYSNCKKEFNRLITNFKKLYGEPSYRYDHSDYGTKKINPCQKELSKVFISFNTMQTIISLAFYPDEEGVDIGVLAYLP